MEFLDTNIILRYLTKDDPDKAERCRHLLQQTEQRTLDLVISESVLAEVVFVLSSPALYGQPRRNIRSLLLPIVRLPGLKVPNRKTMLRALDLYAQTNLDFTDALSVAHMERLQLRTIVSYDRHFDRISGIGRREP